MDFNKTIVSGNTWVSPARDRFRRLGTAGIYVTPVGLGCWPIAGVTSVGVTRETSLATVRAALEAGINFFDTAYCYGYEGESEKILAEVLGPVRKDVVIATKGGIHWENQKQVVDGSPVRLRQEFEESLRRLRTDHVDLLYLHAPDPKVPITESAGELARLKAEGKTRSVGLSNGTLAELQAFHGECPIVAYQARFNMLQQEIASDRVPWCRENQISVISYWPLMKGLLAGHLKRDTVFDPKDGRPKYPIYQGEQWERNLDFVEKLRPIASQAGRTLAQLVVNWTILQKGVTVALCGAKRPDQILETAAGVGWRLTDAEMASIESAIADRLRLEGDG